jgi:hypothetical protein
MTIRRTRQAAMRQPDEARSGAPGRIGGGLSEAPDRRRAALEFASIERARSCGANLLVIV